MLVKLALSARDVLKAKTRRSWPGLGAVLQPDLIIPRGGKLLCQLLINYIWIVLIELDGFSEWQGLDTAILPGKAERVFDSCNFPGLMGMLKKLDCHSC
jgi:hypothetical protein